MADNNAYVPSLLIPLHEQMLLLPNAAVAEIVGYRDLEPVNDSPQWLLGLLPWRGRQLPVVAYESVLAQEPPPAHNRLRVAILNTLNGNPDLPFVGIVLRGLPHLVKAGETNVAPATDGDAEQAGVLCQVSVNGQAALIPDLDALERMLTDSPADG